VPIRLKAREGGGRAAVSAAALSPPASRWKRSLARALEGISSERVTSMGTAPGIQLLGYDREVFSSGL
jgi:hypothetical protein